MGNYNSHSKTLNAICERHPHIESCHSEDDGHNDDGRPAYWIYTIPGYVSSETECGTIHEGTVRECIEMIRTIEEGVYEDGHSIPKKWASEAS